ncbi:MAG: undecaprenyl-diphosphate phosphatase [Betaproteobacteria bacterium]|nr:undecaprenyl-diphosphate phosphatase [Betaproteobacteria bacterium]MCL2162332.1 undecaprenyl-diphosphate phosphatase [Betaproteobacteria bacterium]
MDIQTFIVALLLGIVEGVTEFLPISSTGHLIIASSLLGANDEIVDVFNIVVQLAAILAVWWVFRTRIAELTVGILRRPRDHRSMRFVLMLFLAFLPAAILGVLFHKQIKQVLFNPYVVAGALIVGGFIILIVERFLKNRPQQADINDITANTAIKIGFAQALSMIPGTSRAGATIIGGVVFGLSRRAATEFSFFLAIPTMLGATVLDVYKNWHLFRVEHIPFFAVGCLASFISAMWAVRFLLRYISTHTFVPFAYYRIVFGVIVFATGYYNLVEWVP